MSDWFREEGFVQNGDVRLHYYAAGPQDGEPLILLHGFPQSPYVWRHHLLKLAEQGYRVVAPDLRGYNLSDAPEGVEAYAIERLVGDLGAFYNHFQWQAAHVVAHDWGGGVAWPFVALFPQQVKRFVVMDIGHPLAMRASMQTIQQIAASWYIWFFQSPGVAEKVFGEDIARFLTLFMRGSARPGTFTDEDFSHYVQALERPGHFTAILNYYRANFNPTNIYLASPPTLPQVSVPTLLIYGELDKAFAPTVWEETPKFCSGPFRAEKLANTGHWILEEEPEKTLQLVLEHLKS